LNFNNHYHNVIVLLFMMGL